MASVANMMVSEDGRIGRKRTHNAVVQPGLGGGANALAGRHGGAEGERPVTSVSSPSQGHATPLRSTSLETTDAESLQILQHGYTQGYRTLSRTSSLDDREAVISGQAKMQKCFHLWWRVTFAPYSWKRERPALAWGIKIKDLGPDSAWRLPSPSVLGVQSLASEPSHNEATIRLSQPKQELVESSPRHSMRVLLQDNVVLGNPSMQRSHDYWSAQPVMTNVHGWHTRTSRSIDGPTRFALKSRRNQQRKQTGQMHNLLELRAAHNRHKILKLLVQEHIQRETVGLNPQRFTSHDMDYHELTDIERYLHSWRNAHADGGKSLRAVLAISVFQNANQDIAPSLGSTAVRETGGGQPPVSGGATPMVSMCETLSKCGGDMSMDGQDEADEAEQDLQRRRSEEMNQERRRKRQEAARQRQNYLKSQAQQLRKCERHLNAAAFAVRESDSRLKRCWRAYLDTGNTLHERQQALKGIERALASSQRLEEEERAAREMHQECMQASKIYEQLLDTAAKIVAKFFRQYVLREALSKADETRPPGSGSPMMLDRSFTFTDLITSSTIKEAVREELEMKEHKKAVAKTVLNLSLGEKSEVQKRWTEISHGIINENNLRAFIKISLRSVSRSLEEACKDWTLGRVRRARRALEIAKETNKRTVENSAYVLHLQLRTQFLQQTATDEERLSDLESYINASITADSNASADFTSSFVTNGTSSLTFLAAPQGDETRYASDNSFLTSHGSASDTHDLSITAPSILSRTLSESSAFPSAKKPARSIAEEVAAQKQQHLGLLPERLLAHEMDERWREEHLRTFRQDLKLS